MADTTKKVHPRMAEALANAEKAAVSNRGMYPYTKASNVLDSTGEPLEARDEAEEDDDDDTPTQNGPEEGGDDDDDDSSDTNPTGGKVE